jgi:RNA polymerase sigma factor (sigma-70 family)
MTDSQRLLREYANGSEPAFRELVSRYVNLVYSAAVRLVDGDAHLAEDVAQTVFVDLARKAETLSRDVMLGGWLHRHTCFVASKVMRSERRRQFRERQAVQMNALDDHTEANLAQIRPFLDEAINGLGAEDRAAVLLRFFEQCDFRAIGTALRTNEDAAQKRVTRALEKLQVCLKRRGVVFSTAALGTMLAADAVTAAPVGLAAGISVTALSGVAAGSGTTLMLVNLMATKLKFGMLSAVLAASVAIPLVMQQRASARLRDEDQSLKLQANQLAQLRAEHDRLSDQATGAKLTQSQLNDLQKLRSEIGPLRQQAGEVAKLQAENRQLQSAKRRDTGPKSALQQKEEVIGRMNYSKAWVLAFYMYADKNGGRFPTNFDLALPFLDDRAKNQENVKSDQFEIVFDGALKRVKNPSDIIVLREKEAWETISSENGHRWARLYGFVDGHIEVHSEPENNFEAYEKQHMMPPSDQ